MSLPAREMVPDPEYQIVLVPPQAVQLDLDVDPQRLGPGNGQQPGVDVALHETTREPSAPRPSRARMRNAPTMEFS